MGEYRVGFAHGVVFGVLFSIIVMLAVSCSGQGDVPRDVELEVTESDHEITELPCLRVPMATNCEAHNQVRESDGWKYRTYTWDVELVCYRDLPRPYWFLQVNWGIPINPTIKEKCYSEGRCPGFINLYFDNPGCFDYYVKTGMIHMPF